MFLRKSTTLKYLITVPLGVIFYCEWFDYVIQPLFWPDFACKNEESCTKILFIADPQIQGDLAVPPPLGSLVNWDSDRYLASTFSVVLKHFKPDVLVYLGDLMDEGSVSTTAQYHSYVKRLSNIFDVYYPVVQVWVPGDNDIGGENEPINHNKVAEFSKVFDQPSVITFRNITFYKINSIMYKVPQAPDDADLNVRIAVAHYPVLSKGVYGKQVNNALHPDIYFCAHEHVSKYVKQQKDFSSKHTYLLQRGAPVLEVSFDDDSMYEIFVPTCSYRMGTNKIGYGAAILESQHSLKYTVFWSPQRFPHLLAYLVVVIIVISYVGCFALMRLISRQPRLVRNDDILPLLHRK
ncbi:uncharacterized protein LOC112051865 [Bicyclus anynana]|uniref:Uncharacterized protein LOC112051865 n=1 Tax=Bicyclus anynana TaxID=110368 RepID=A0A6J1NFA0_BICAN|nr:uncharacterized protein LOC112051865 [Bicyclus anynana]